MSLPAGKILGDRRRSPQAELPGHRWAMSKVLASDTELFGSLAMCRARGSVGELVNPGIAHGIREDADLGKGHGHEDKA